MAYLLSFITDEEKYSPGHWFGNDPKHTETDNDDYRIGDREVWVHFLFNRKIPDDELYELPTSFTIQIIDGFVPDFLPSRGGSGWFVPDSFRELVERFEPGVHQFIPIKGYDRKGMKPLDKKFFLMNICKTLEDFVNVERSDLYRDETEYPDGIVLARYFPLKSPPDPVILRGEAIAGHHLWDGGTVGDGGRWYGPYVSDALWQAMREAGLNSVYGGRFQESHDTEPANN